MAQGNPTAPQCKQIEVLLMYIPLAKCAGVLCFGASDSKSIGTVIVGTPALFATPSQVDLY